MKKILPILSMLLASFAPLFAADADPFDKVVDFSLGIKEISALAQNPAFNPANHSRTVIFDGSVAAVSVLEPSPEKFLAELEVIGGEWNALETVSLFRVFVYVQGPEFAARLPQRQPKEPAPNPIAMNDHLLIAGTIADVYTDEKGGRFAVILARYIRVMP